MRKITLAVLFLVVLASSICAFATAQMGDKLIMNGKNYFIQSNPLEKFLERHPDLLPEGNVTSTANWRGYIATWTVKGDHLVLTDVQIQMSKKTDQDGSSTEWVSVMNKMFPGQKEVVAHWFRGYIIVPDGKMVRYVHMGYASTYEKYIVLKVENGKLVRNESLDSRQFIAFRDAQFAFFKKTDEFKKAMDEASKDGGMTAAQNEEFIREYFSGEYLSTIYD